MDKKLEKAMANLQEAEAKANNGASVPPDTSAGSNSSGSVVTPRVLKEAQQKEAPVKVLPPKVVLSENATKLREFVRQTDAIYAQNPGTPYEKWYATAQAWSYLAALNKVHIDISRVWNEKDPTDANATVVYASGDLIDDETGDILSTSTMCASTNENWLTGKPLSAAYGLAQTRLEERLLKNKFGYQLSLAHLEPVGAEELDVDVAIYGNRDKEI